MSPTPVSSLDKEPVERFLSSWQVRMYTVVVGVVLWLLAATADHERRRLLGLWAAREQR